MMSGDDEKQDELGCDPRTGIQNHIVNRPRAARQIALMPFIEAGDEGCSEHRNVGPAERPSRIGRRRQSFAPRPEKKNAEEAIAEHMSGLADEEVVPLKAREVHPEKKVKKWIKEAAGVLRGQIGRRLNSDDNQPQDQGDPGLDEMVAVATQAGRHESSHFSQRRREAGSAYPGANSKLFNGIVWSFARDHDIVDMALAEARAADADESRLLQQFRDRRAAAVSHARL